MCRAAAPSRLLIRPATAAVTSPARGNSFRLIVKVSMAGRHFHGAVTPRHFYVAVAPGPGLALTRPRLIGESARAMTTLLELARATTTSLRLADVLAAAAAASAARVPAGF